MGTILRIDTVPSQGGDTLFASMYAAYDALSAHMREFLDGLTAEHRADYTGFYGDHAPQRAAPRSIHPVIRTHPMTGRKCLFVNAGFTRRIMELAPAESDALLAFLFEHVKHPRFQCRFRWEKNSVAFWDNRCTQHLAVWDYYPERRSGLRVTIKGDRPFH
jgi:taurine dioxygenase